VDRLKEKQIILQLRSKESVEMVAVHRRKKIDHSEKQSICGGSSTGVQIDHSVTAKQSIYGGGGSSSHA
jgi:hypothetical protein